MLDEHRRPGWRLAPTNEPHGLFNRFTKSPGAALVDSRSAGAVALCGRELQSRWIGKCNQDGLVGGWIGGWVDMDVHAKVEYYSTCIEWRPHAQRVVPDKFASGNRASLSIIWKVPCAQPSAK